MSSGSVAFSDSAGSSGLPTPGAATAWVGATTALAASETAADGVSVAGAMETADVADASAAEFLRSSWPCHSFRVA